MKNYWVRIPITAYADVLVENAESEDAAIKQAFDKVSLDDVQEWETHHEICQGNVCHASQNCVEVYED